jgi:threonine/homoserine/homoserine lactone efflux protein
MQVLSGIHDWPLFIGAGLLLNLTPGVDMALVLRCSAGQGFRAGAAAALGVGAGCGVHIALAALGLSALLAGSPLAFGLLRWTGAAYLVWLGWDLMRPRRHSSPAYRNAAEPASPPALAALAAPWLRLFGQGFMTNALNPKVAMFFLAFVPQFIATDARHKSGAFLLLGAVFVVNATAVNLALAWAAAALHQRLGTDRARPLAVQALGRWLNRGVGALLVGLGLRLALGDPLR